MIRVFIVAASATTCSVLEAMLGVDARFEVIGSGQTIASAVSSLHGHRPDVLLVEAAETAKQASQNRFNEGSVVVLLTDDWSRPEIRMALHNGARGILGRNFSRHELAAAIEAAAAGLIVLGSEYMDALLPSSLGHFDASEISMEPLTSRESEILALLAEGVGNKEIAERLHLSAHTVKFHVSSVLGKLGASSRTEAVAEGIRRGMVLV